MGLKRRSGVFMPSVTFVLEGDKPVRMALLSAATPFQTDCQTSQTWNDQSAVLVLAGAKQGARGKGW